MFEIVLRLSSIGTFINMELKKKKNKKRSYMSTFSVKDLRRQGYSSIASFGASSSANIP